MAKEKKSAAVECFEECEEINRISGIIFNRGSQIVGIENVEKEFETTVPQAKKDKLQKELDQAKSDLKELL